jgi:membrane protease YdiL (CAAX protease family)
MSTLRELRAMGLLVLRSWYRMGPRLRGGRKPEPTRGFSAVLMRLVFAALIYNFGYTLSVRLAAHPEPVGPVTWSALGVGLFGLSISIALELPLPRTATLPLKSELLEMLPLSRLSKLVLGLSQAFLALLFSLGLVISVRRSLAPEASLFAALSLAVSLFVVFSLAGACLGKLLRRVLSPYRASRLTWASTVSMLLGMLLLQLAPSPNLLPTPPFGLALGQALLGHGAWSMAGALTLGALLLGALIFRLERGQELSEPVRPDATPSAFQGMRADMRTLEHLLTRREPGGRFQNLFAVAFHVVYVLALTWLLPEHVPNARFFWNTIVIMTLQLTSQLGMQRATRSATRDMLARPLLGSLPIAPADTLVAKASALRRTLLLVAAPLTLCLVVGYWQRPWLPELTWRIAFTLMAVWIYASTASYVAFLTAGLGSTRPRGGAFGSLESFLVIIPFASVLFAAGPGSAALSLLTLAALTFEARRAARGSIEWQDDPEREHGTEVWKALVVFGAFQGAQVLAQQLTAFFSDVVSAAVRMLAAYVLAATALWLMTEREQESRPEARAKLAPLGLAAGALSGAFAWLYLHALRPVAEDSAGLQMHGVWEGVCLAVTVVVVAPLVEERFFRGWLQLALERALGARRYLAPLLTGLAFAAAHPAYSFAPVLVLGLINGFVMLRLRSLSACVVTHAVHNALALWFAS